MKIVTIAFVVLLLSVASISNAAIGNYTITFDPPPLPGGGMHISSYTENGFIFSTPTGMTHRDSGVSDAAPDNGTAYLRFAYDNQPLTIEMADQGVVFSLYQVDLAQYSLYFSTDTVVFTGHRSDGSTVNQSFSLTDGIIFNSFVFDPSFNDLTSVEVDVIGYAMDNLQVSVYDYTAPDLTISKSNNVSGTTSLDDNNNGAWTWSLVIDNTGTGEAVFGDGETIFSDQMPTTDISYGTISIDSVNNITNSGNIFCTISEGLLTCVANGANVIIGDTTGTFTVSFTSTPQAEGTFINPTGGTCSIDPEDNITETDETNNSCVSDSVVVSAPDLQSSKTNSTSGEVGENGSFNWTITVANVGSDTAFFNTGETILIDDLPIGATYGTPDIGSFTGIIDSGYIICTIDDTPTLDCSVTGVGPVGIGTGGSFVVTIPVIDAGDAGSLVNPDGTCSVDPGNVIGERDETNNGCGDEVTVTVSSFQWWTFWPDIMKAAQDKSTQYLSR